MKEEIKKILQKHTPILIERIETGPSLKMPGLVDGTSPGIFDPRKHAKVEYPFPSFLKMLDELTELFEEKLKENQ